MAVALPSVRQGVAGLGRVPERSGGEAEALTTLARSYEAAGAAHSEAELAKIRAAAESILRQALTNFRRDPGRVEALVTRWAQEFHLPRLLGDLSRLYTDLAFEESRARRLTQAQRYLEQALMLDPENVRALFAQLCQKRASVVLKQLGSDALAGRCEADSMRAAVSGSIEWIEAALNVLTTDEEDLVAPLRDARARLLSILNGG